MEAREEKGELAAKVAELLEARLKDAEEAAQPASSPKGDANYLLFEV